MEAAISPARLLGFLDKVKAYPSLKISAPEMFRNMDVSEPNSESSRAPLYVRKPDKQTDLVPTLRVGMPS
jgi:hypothetical protein